MNTLLKIIRKIKLIIVAILTIPLLVMSSFIAIIYDCVTDQAELLPLLCDFISYIASSEDYSNIFNKINLG